MKKSVALALLCIAALLTSAAPADAGPIRRFLDNRRARLNAPERGPVMHPFSAIRSAVSGGCAGGFCPAK